MHFLHRPHPSNQKFRFKGSSMKISPRNLLILLVLILNATAYTARATCLTTQLVNGSFEEPSLTPGVPDFMQYDASLVPGWQTTASDNRIEIWSDGFGFPPYDGSQFAEINATETAALFQDVNIPAGETLCFTFAHRARFAVGPETLRLDITDLGVGNIPGGGDDTLLFSKIYTADDSAWIFNTSDLEPPTVALGNVVRFSLESLQSGEGGNLIDALKFGSAAKLPDDLPWLGWDIKGRTGIVQPGIAAVSCGTTLNVVDPSERFTFGLMNINNVVPASTRADVTGVQMYHHPSWLVTEVGNIFGVAINEPSGDILLSASSNYAAAFFGQTSVIQYGAIGGGFDDLAAAGTIYQIDAVTGQASVFSVLPQQSVEITHGVCEGGTPISRNTGVGLGNIHYDQSHDQYFVTNVEDGRIYRLGSDGMILDSYDPGIYDDCAPGITSLTDLVYGVAIEPNGERLFLGGVTANNLVPLLSIDLLPSGEFDGSIDNTCLPAGATWNNYVGVETLHTDIPTAGGGFVFHLSDLEFTPNLELLAGIRVGCDNSWFTSYNHGGESNLISQSSSTLYDSITEFDVSFTDEDSYGGVSFFQKADLSVDFVVSSADIIDEPGPHGIAVFHSVDAATSPISPLAAISYGLVDNGDPKGVGGSVDVLGSDPNVLFCDGFESGDTSVWTATEP